MSNSQNFFLIGLVLVLIFLFSLSVNRSDAQARDVLIAGETAVRCQEGAIIMRATGDESVILADCLVDDDEDPTPTPSATPDETSTPTATPDADPTNTPTPIATATEQPDPPTSGFGVYPDCNAPAIGLETHSWWHENGEVSPRHVHIATCLPNARAVNDGVAFDGTLSTVFRVMAFNMPNEIEWVRYQWQGDTQETRNFGERCQNSPDEFKECKWYLEFAIDADAANGGLDELRLSPNIDHHDLGTRQFPTLNFQIRTGNGGNYRNSEEPISRSWYSGLSYARVQWSDYMDLFNGRYDLAIPVVSGTINIDVRHTKSSGSCLSSEGYVDPNFHAFHAGNGAEPQPFYDESGCFDGNQSLDTTTLSNGIHTIYLQTRVGDGRGFNAAAIAYQINVQN